MIASALRRGSVVIVDFGPPANTRPALVVQNDRDNSRMLNTIVVQITSNVTRAHEPTQLLIDHAHPDWHVSGLYRPSMVNCSNIVFIHRKRIGNVIGSLSAATMLQVNECLKVALALP